MELKWIFFKDCNPIIARFFYFTDFVTIRVSTYEDLEATKLSDCAWAEIPIPQVPEKKKENHQCWSECNKFCCNEHSNFNFLMFSSKENGAGCPVLSCPFCGYKPEES